MTSLLLDISDHTGTELISVSLMWVFIFAMSVVGIIVTTYFLYKAALYLYKKLKL